MNQENDTLLFKERSMIEFFDGVHRFLSNFDYSPVHAFGRTFKTLEHAFQFAKTNNLEWQNQIANAPTPSQAKHLGRRCPLRSDWNQIKDQVMKDLLAIKFSNVLLKKKLLLTKGCILIEGNTWHDNYWGDCHCSKCISIKGKNKLGRFLMELRDSL